MKRRGTKAYFAANLLVQVVGLLRFILLARFLGAEELGVAAMLILTAQFFQSVSDTGSDRFLIQDEDGDSPVMQGMIHGVLALRGVLICLALILFGGPVARLFNEPELTMSFIGLSLAPLIGGFTHLDLRRVQREGDFRPESWGLIVAEPLGLICTVAAAAITHDHTAVIYGLTARALGQTVVSHLTAERPYRWAWSKPMWDRFSGFAMPLFLNGLLLFFGSQGDRVLIGANLGSTALGHYSAILLLIYYPSGMLTRFLVGISLPPVARARNDPERFQEETNRLGGRTLLLALSMMFGFALVAPVSTVLFYGKSFAQPLELFALIGALQSARFLRTWLTTIANSIGKSTIILLNNVARLLGLGAALLVNQLFHSLDAIVISFILGEVASLLVALALLRRANAVSINRELGRVLIFLAGCAAAVACAWTLEARWYGFLAAAGAFTAAYAVLLLRSERNVISELVDYASRRVRKALARPR
ncbi:oligosaccharide flippase family protein [Phenylobacterium sp.]|uniref:oligosaccharide flippase family protein n=1 Tax=Phenylobacterium sp. TaxID=1871053 RepID=UPI0025D89910|nr:oligosaccharide flippase family protein [Phenylobacterium sp.]MBX3483731.1 oligosaccharide flippase family protein [Phenylobacterium sp.]MCW5758146.1 oligosaccharide flippase family protein [Phenylobacterium sp.]